MIHADQVAEEHRTERGTADEHQPADEVAGLLARDHAPARGEDHDHEGDGRQNATKLEVHLGA